MKLVNFARANCERDCGVFGQVQKLSNMVGEQYGNNGNMLQMQ
jgi:hypothetical protein